MFTTENTDGYTQDQLDLLNRAVRYAKRFGQPEVDETEDHWDGNAMREREQHNDEVAQRLYDSFPDLTSDELAYKIAQEMGFV